MAQPGPPESLHLSGRLRDEIRWRGRRAAHGSVVTSGVETFTAPTSVQSNSLLVNTNTQKPTTQTHSSTDSLTSNARASLTTSSSDYFTSTTSSTPSSSSLSPTLGPSDSNGESFLNSHKLLLAGMIAGFLGLVLAVCIIVWILVRRARRRRTDEVARQSFAAGDLLNLSKGEEATPKEAIQMGETSHFNSHRRKKGSRDDGWRGLPSQDDNHNHGPSDVVNDDASMRTGGLRSQYVPPAYPSFTTLLRDPPPIDASQPAVAPPYTLTGAFANALSAEDDDERDQSTSHQSHSIVARIERGPQMRVPQPHPHPHPYADPALMSSAVTAEQTISYPNSSSMAQGHQQSALVNVRNGRDVELVPPMGGSRPGNPLPPTSSAALSAHTTTASDVQGETGNLAPHASLGDDPPSPSSKYSEGCEILHEEVPTEPGPVVSLSSREAFVPPTSPATFLSASPSNSSRNGGMLPRVSGKPTKQERAMNVRALNDLIAALDSIQPPSASLNRSPGINGQGSSSIPDAGMWRAALGTSPMRSVQKGGDDFDASRNR